MKLRNVRIQNFRSLRDVSVPFNDYTCIVGPNGSGKSTVIAALNVFFRHYGTSPISVATLQEDDFHGRVTKEPIIITLTFEDLSAEAQEDFKHYYRHGRLIVSAHATWNSDSKSATVSQHGIRLGIRAFAPFFAKYGQGEKLAELKVFYESLRATYKDLPPPGTKPAMIEALHAYEAGHAELQEEIPSPAEFYGISKGENRLQKHVQWVHVPAVKDASQEDSDSRTSWFKDLLVRAVRSKVKFDDTIKSIELTAKGQYSTLLEGQQGALKALSESLTARMTSWATPDARLDLRWEIDADKAVSVQQPFARVFAADGVFQGAIARHGHGYQRSYLLALLTELAFTGGEGEPTLILGCEEPELYQHPPQARHLAATFEQLSQKGTQVVLCTHSPYFLSGRVFEDVRLMRRAPGGSESTVAFAASAALKATLEEAKHSVPCSPTAAEAQLHQALQPDINEMFFSPVLVLVEGLEDYAYLTSHLALSGRMDEFRRLGCHIVPAGGKSCMPQLLAVAKLLGIPTFAMFDGDSDVCVVPAGLDGPALQKAEEKRDRHLKDNAAILHLSGLGGEPALPTDTLQRPSLVQWKTCIGDTVKADVGADQFGAAKSKARNELNLQEGDFQKNVLFIGRVLSTLAAAGKKSASLETTCVSILAFASAARSGGAAASPTAGTSDAASAPAAASPGV